MMPHHEQIERRAYELYEQRRRADGHDREDWLQAEDEVRASEASSPQTNVDASTPRRLRRDERAARFATT
jgi:hypothetical protein